MPVSMFWDNEQQRGDVLRALDANGNETNVVLEGDGLVTSSLISTFTDGLAAPEDLIPDGSDNRRGWWGDAFLRPSGDTIGGRVWVVTDQGKLTTSEERKLREATADAHRWMLDDNVAESVNVQSQILAPGVVGLKVQITKPGEPAPQWEPFWLNVQFG